METWDAMDRTQRLMAEHGLTGWHFKYTSARSRFGLCDHINKVISLSRHITELNAWEEVCKTVMHEIAHALVGPYHGHNDVWKNKMVELGQNPSRTYDAVGNGRSVVKAERQWQGMCPNCGQLGKYFRRRKLICARCHRAGHTVSIFYIKAQALDKNQ